MRTIFLPVDISLDEKWWAGCNAAQIALEELEKGVALSTDPLHCTVVDLCIAVKCLEEWSSTPTALIASSCIQASYLIKMVTIRF